MLTLIEGGAVYSPEPCGVQSVLLANDLIEKIGEVDRRVLDRLGVDYDVVDASDCIVLPGLIDPHAHLLGGSGEGGLPLATPEIFVEEIVSSGVTTLVGTLGVDTTMKTIEGLLGRVKALNEVGPTTKMWSGGYNVPPTTLLHSVRQDMMFVDEVIGVGEIAVSDERGLNQSSQELAKVVRDTHVGGLLSGKAGLRPLREIVDEFQCKCEWLYPTHVQRNEKLLREAIDLANGGSFVDMDVVNEDLDKWLRFYIENGGPLDKLTVSSDMDSSTPELFHDQFCGLVVRHGFSLDQILPLFTSNTARALKLSKKGCLREGHDADVVILDRTTLAVRTVFARGRSMLRDGVPLVREKWLEKSKRRFQMVGDDHPSRRSLKA
jgi:beta-aspartyl-dipeptidase (metallo-type)